VRWVGKMGEARGSEGNGGSKVKGKQGERGNEVEGIEMERKDYKNYLFIFIYDNR
jgi:hypothetical protein